jgi:hypothetical protein
MISNTPEKLRKLLKQVRNEKVAKYNRECENVRKLSNAIDNVRKEVGINRKVVISR